ncbi:DUF3570 domain-containing protein [Mesohalobacter halotolerans]|uniref:DUF3570 domain-containing protein n=1 Tax=Mesohalobacter halotolerans TaxID=1883405 RepID=A0A4U5TPE3_9FLAO|nr:DUF3570 domain-containing protein [Mesohalobacter halotolerans]TKS55561.1 DUF3570 domain-containing protein [Mesohalobacter halotolerans]
MKYQLLFVSLLVFGVSMKSIAQDSIEYKKRVLDQMEIKVLSSYYSQDGDNAAVTGGRGTEELTDLAPIINVAIPLNDDDVLTIDASVSAYTSASSSNIDPFDGNGRANAFVESTGDSRKDTWFGLSANYSHSSDDRNTIWTANSSFAIEYDYTSIGFGGSYTRLFNEKNTEVQLRGNVFIDFWNPQYPIEFRDGFNPNNFEFTGTTNFAPNFEEFADTNRNSYNLGINFSQILSKTIQTSFISDVVLQDGLLSTPHQRVMFADIEDTVVEDFTLGNDVEKLPDSRLKIALANRTNFYLTENFILRSYYRFYTDDWGINSHTFELELPIKLGMNYTLYPSYRYYTQTEADYFNGFNQALSTDEYYTSDFDLADYDAHQYGIGFKYYDPLNKFRVGGFGLKSINIEFNQYSRTSQNFDAFFTSIGLSFSALK